MVGRAVYTELSKGTFLPSPLSPLGLGVNNMHFVYEFLGIQEEEVNI